MIDVQQADGVTTVHIDHPPVNALDLGLVDDAVATVRSIDGPIVLTGAGSCFSAGVDLRAILDGGADYSDRFLAALSFAFLAVFDHPAPVVAAINGHAIAGGCVLAMAADFRLMSAGLIGLSEVAVGVPFPVAALEICRYSMGPSVTRAVLQADNVDVLAAAQRGWIDEVVAPDDLLIRAVRDRSRARAAPGDRLRADEIATTPARPRGDRRGRGARRERAGDLEVGRNAGADRRVPRRAQVIVRQVISMLSASRTGKFTLT